MKEHATIENVKSFISSHSEILIIQADNPDADSLGSSLALEHILGDMGKTPLLYCGVDMPAHLRHLPGWDRVSKDVPPQFDASIIVDTSVDSLLESLEKSGQKSWVASKPCLVIDHHDVKCTIPFASLVWNQPAVATGEIVYELATKLKWPLELPACNMLAVSILSDSLGLTSEGTTARTIHIVAELVERGVNLAQLENQRREMQRKSPELVRYKGSLLQRITYSDDGRIALVTIPWKEIETYSHEYNPSMLVLDDMRLTEGVKVAMAFKQYPDGKITAKIRTNFGSGVAAKLAEAFGGGGHPFASGFKLSDGRSLDTLIQECIQKTNELLDTIEANANEAT